MLSRCRQFGLSRERNKARFLTVDAVERFKGGETRVRLGLVAPRALKSKAGGVFRERNRVRSAGSRPSTGSPAKMVFRTKQPGSAPDNPAGCLSLHKGAVEQGKQISRFCDSLPQKEVRKNIQYDATISRSCSAYRNFKWGNPAFYLKRGVSLLLYLSGGPGWPAPPH
jgi:hypothetical protein